MTSDSKPGPAEVIAEAFAAVRRSDPNRHARPGREAAVVIDQHVLPALRSSRLTLFVGAGVSYASGFPGWSELLRRLASIIGLEETVYQLLIHHTSPLLMARFLRNHIGDHTLFPSRLHEALYGPDVDYHRSNAALDFVIALAGAAEREGATLRIVTYNFDDLLEYRLAAYHPNIAWRTVSDASAHRRGHSTVEICHVHGYLPRQPAGSRETWPQVILAEDNFHVLMSDGGAWANRVQADAFMYDDCLFVGLSMTDPNLRRLMDIAKPAAAAEKSWRYILARSNREGDFLSVGRPALDAATADALNRIEDHVAACLAAVRVTLPDHAAYASLAKQVTSARR